MSELEAQGIPRPLFADVVHLYGSPCGFGGPKSSTLKDSEATCPACLLITSLRTRLAESEAGAAVLRDGMEMAWGVIANASHGDWDKEGAEWRGAAEHWRDKHWHPMLSSSAGKETLEELERLRREVRDWGIAASMEPMRQADAVDPLLAEIKRLRARVAELEEEDEARQEAEDHARERAGER